VRFGFRLSEIRAPGLTGYAKIPADGRIVGLGNFDTLAEGESDRVEKIDNRRPLVRIPGCRALPIDEMPLGAAVTARDQCLEQLLEAFADIADRDDIHQAAERLARVQEWITREAEAAASDPIFAVLRLAS
jgi:hypothetical protein